MTNAVETYLAALTRVITSAPETVQVYALHPAATAKRQRFWLREHLSTPGRTYRIARHPPDRLGNKFVTVIRLLKPVSVRTPLAW